MSGAAEPLDVSVVIPTFNRVTALERLLGQLADQTVPPDRYEVVVVDDGSAVPVRGALSPRPYRLRVEEQRNAGAAAARQRGALLAAGEVLVFIDDDMQIGRGFLDAHARCHPAGSRRAVLGRIRPPEAGGKPLLERWHQHHLDRLAARSAAGEALGGTSLYTGNLSLRRADFVAVGGFDPDFVVVEDSELGVRLEKAGFAIGVSEEASCRNNDVDEYPASAWRRRARRWGQYERRMARKHQDLPHASPWRYLTTMPLVARPVLVGSALLPGPAAAFAAAAYAGARAADHFGLERIAFKAVGLAFCVEYFRGVREELGSARAVLADARSYLRRRTSGPPAGERG